MITYYHILLQYEDITIDTKVSTEKELRLRWRLLTSAGRRADDTIIYTSIRQVALFAQFRFEGLKFCDPRSDY